jgi:hypothetical protein
MNLAGFGKLAFGRHNFGAAESRFEPRFYSSIPVDGSSGISVYETTISFIVYGFSSLIDLDSLHLRISEDDGGSYVDAYDAGSFVAPFNGANSGIQRKDGQQTVFRIHKSAGSWADEQVIRVEVTVDDSYGDEATKETPVVW